MMTLAKAHKIIEGSTQKAQELGIKVSTSVVDEHGVIVALHRMDGAFYISPQFATSKAHTSALLGLPSGAIAQYAAPGKPYFGINTAWGGEVLPIDGGLPVKEGEKVIGGVGVGGSLDVAQDAECAEAGLKALAE